MGDRFERKRKTLGVRLIARRGKPPPEILAWGLGDLASIGHNNGPPLDDDAPGYVWRRYRWTKVHAEVWKTPPLAVLKFRMARAEAACLSYRDYMLALLDTGRHPQARDRDVERTEALVLIRAAWADVITQVAPESGRMARGLVLSSLIAAYDDESRHYHDLVHIGAILRGLGECAAAPPLALRAPIASSGIPPHPNPPPHGGRESRALSSKPAPATANSKETPSPVARRAHPHDVGEGRGGGDSVTVENGNVLILAILFHDAVYDARCKDNEAASARLVRLHLKDLGVAAETIERVEALILATHHGGEVAAGDTDMALLVDLDLAILAAPPQRYAAYAAAIRREYAHVPEEQFRRGRAAVLETFLARPRLYATPALAERWEALARANLAAECAVLRGS